MQNHRKAGFATRAIHAGQEPDPTTGAVMSPIHVSSTYAQASPGKHKGYEYSRTQNPTRMAYERCIADLESGVQGFAFASGLAATATVLDLLDSGAHVVAMEDLYGGTRRLFSQVRARSAMHECLQITEIIAILQRQSNQVPSRCRIMRVNASGTPRLAVTALAAKPSPGTSRVLIAIRRDECGQDVLLLERWRLAKAGVQ